MNECQKKLQSPIDLVDALSKAGKGTKLSAFFSSAENTKFSGIKHNHGVYGGAGNKVVAGANIYNLLGIHWHAPSEHTLNGKSFEAEVHLVGRRIVRLVVFS